MPEKLWRGFDSRIQAIDSRTKITTALKFLVLNQMFNLFNAKACIK